MTKLYALLVLLSLGCGVPPVWEGEGDLDLWVESDELWEAVAGGCDDWGALEMPCDRVSRCKATIEVVYGDVPGTAVAVSNAHMSWYGSWSYSLTIDRSVSGDAPRLRLIAAHELGHLLGIWDHLEEGPALMTAEPTSNVPTTLDLDALPFEW